MTNDKFRADYDEEPEKRLNPIPAERSSSGAERSQKALLANIRHDLRTPINAIIGYSEMLLEEVDDSQALFIADLSKICSAGRQLLELVNRILDPKRIEAEIIDIDSQAVEAQLRRELRDPLNTVIGYTEILLEESKELGKETFVSDLGKIAESGKRLLDSLDNIISVSKAQASKAGLSTELTNSSVFINETLADILPDGRRNDSVKDVYSGSILVVDDNDLNRDLLSRHLEHQGYTVSHAINGREALDRMTGQKFDLVLLDMMMPELNGFQVLQIMKSDTALRHIPVIVISALDEVDAVARCISLGATDYLPKPFNPMLLQARINSSLAVKRMYDMEQDHIKAIQEEQQKSERLLLNILPSSIVARLKEGEGVIADFFAEATVLFADLVGFTAFSARNSPKMVVQKLNAVFSTFDELVEKHGLEKIKTIGDGYMVAGGIPVPRRDHVKAVANLALAMRDEMLKMNKEEPNPLSVRIGIHSGSVVAGIIGTKKFAYDLWGDTVNTASRLESNGIPGNILTSEATYFTLRDNYLLRPNGPLKLKGKGEEMTYILEKAVG